MPRNLSTGHPSTLGSYLALCETFFGKDSKPAKFISQKIASEPKGAEAEVLADEGQMVALLGSML